MIVHGPLTDRWGPFVTAVQPHPVLHDVWFALTQRGTKGTGKVWNPSLIKRNLRRDVVDAEFVVFGEVKTSQSTREHGFTLRMWNYVDMNDQRSFKATFATQQQAIDFMIDAARHFA